MKVRIDLISSHSSCQETATCFGSARRLSVTRVSQDSSMRRIVLHWRAMFAWRATRIETEVTLISVAAGKRRAPASMVATSWPLMEQTPMQRFF